MNNSNKNKYSITAVNQAFSVLEFIIKKQSSISATELHISTGIPKATLHKLLQTLKNLNYISQDSRTDRYVATYKPLQVGYYCLNRHQFLKTFYPYALMYLRRFQCPTSLSVYSGNEAVVVYSTIGNADIVVDGDNVIGKTASIYGSSTGRLLLSSMSVDEVRHLLELIPLTPFTWKTPNNIDDVIKSLDIIRKRGYCRLDGEIYYGFSSFSFPLKDIYNRLIGSLNLVLQESRADTIVTHEVTESIKSVFDKVRINPY